MTRRSTPKRTLTKEQAQREREARVYDAMAKFCATGTRGGISSMTISSGGRSVTIDAENGPRMVRNAKAIAAALRVEPFK